jgi:hypothetical protein
MSGCVEVGVLPHGSLAFLPLLDVMHQQATIIEVFVLDFPLRRFE